MTATVLDRQRGTVDREALLGRIIWYTVPESTMIDFKKTVSALTAIGFTKQLPVYPEDHNVFRRVSKNAERRKVERSDTEFENWMIRDVASRDEDTITRRIVVEVVDAKGRRLEYEQIADVEFDRKLKRINFAWINGFNELSHPTAKELMADIQVNFSRWRGKLNDQAFREWIRHQILAMGAICVRPAGGVYFLEERFADDIAKLEQFVADTLDESGECHIVEIPDNDKQREMVRRAIEKETVGAIETMMVEIAKIRKEGFLTPQRHLEMLSKVRILENKMNGYSKLLEKDLGKLQTRLRLLDSTAKGLSPMVATSRRKQKGEG